MNMLHRFWFTFADPPKFSPLGLGCGVTAYDYADASNILKAKVFGEKPALQVESVTVDIDVQTLDRNHVIPNMGVVVNRGIWFPLGYDT
jgi:hypothetical protein